jgi:arabinan endo-1,5-alpha-L-arabinosidase
MKMNRLFLAAPLLLSLASSAFAIEGQVGIHDPSTIAVSGGKYYTFGTGGAALVSDDGWTWRAGARPTDTGLAPDIVQIGDRYYLYTPRNLPPGQPKAEITMISNKTLDPTSPDYKWETGGVVASTNGIEDCNGIDPGVLLDPSTNKLWMIYGSYFGYLRVVELDAKTGKKLPNAKAVDVAINCEAPILIFQDGWYYLLATHGSCCQAGNSNYNIRVGRSRSVTGPYLDHDGIDMMKGGGKLFLGSESRVIGPGHFGRLTLDKGVEVFSYHYEEDLDRPGNFGNLAIRPLLWRDGWPVAGENAKAGTYMLLSERTGTALELSVEGVPLTSGRGGGGRGRGPGPGRGPGGPGAPGAPAAPAPGGAVAAGTPPAGAAPAVPPAAPPPGGGGGRGRGAGGGGAPVPPQDVAVVSKNWPTGNVATRMANYLDQAQQKWSISPAPNAGGYFGAPYFKITVAGTDRALAATPDGELTTVREFNGAPEQLWAIQQLTDGTYRIMPKAVPGSQEPLALTALGNSFATLAKFNAASSQQRWNLKGL